MKQSLQEAFENEGDVLIRYFYKWKEKHCKRQGRRKRKNYEFGDMNAYSWDTDAKHKSKTEIFDSMSTARYETSCADGLL